MVPQVEETYTPEQQQVMQTQDIKYVEMKQTVEEKVRGIAAALFTCSLSLTRVRIRIKLTRVCVNALNPGSNPVK